MAIHIPRFHEFPFHLITRHSHQLFQLGSILRPEPSVAAASQTVEIGVGSQLLPAGIASIGKHHPAELAQRLSGGLKLMLGNQFANLFVAGGLLGNGGVHVYHGAGAGGLVNQSRQRQGGHGR